MVSATISGRKAQSASGAAFSTARRTSIVSGAFSPKQSAAKRAARCEMTPRIGLGSVRGDVRAVEVQQLPRLVLVGDDRRLEPLPGRLVGRFRCRGGERFLEAVIGQRGRVQWFGLLDRDGLRCHGRGSFSGHVESAGVSKLLSARCVSAHDFCEAAIPGPGSASGRFRARRGRRSANNAARPSTKATNSATPSRIEASNDGRFAFAASSTCCIAPATTAGLLWLS